MAMAVCVEFFRGLINTKIMVKSVNGKVFYCRYV